MEAEMNTFKRCVLGAAGVVLVAAGLSLMPRDAEAFKCTRTAIPGPPFKPTGQSCSQVCESNLYVSGSSSVCVILGPNVARRSPPGRRRHVHVRRPGTPHVHEAHRHRPLHRAARR
jgi:hypothetical protein